MLFYLKYKESLSIPIVITALRRNLAIMDNGDLSFK